MSQPHLPSIGVRSAFDAAAQRHTDRAANRTAAPASTTRSPQSTVRQAIASAAEQTGIAFDFLIAQAQVESSMDPKARARTSSASGLFQFIESTWLDTMRRHGARFGLDGVAAQISTARSGAAFVADPAQRSAILAMRNDPEVASLMAAGLAEDNRGALTPILGREPDHGELYLAHFLGSGGAGRFLSAMDDDPDQFAANLFPRSAAANRPIFYDANGTPRSLAGVMEVVSGKLERAMAMNAPGRTYGRLDRASQPSITGDGPVFAPSSPSAVTYRGMSASAPVTLPAPRKAPPMSNTILTAFGDRGGQLLASSETLDRVKRAYGQFRAFGL